MRAAAFDMAAHPVQRGDHRGVICGQFQRLAGVAIGVEDRRNLAGVGAVQGADRPMRKGLALVVGQDQRGLAYGHHDLAALCLDTVTPQPYCGKVLILLKY